MKLDALSEYELQLRTGLIYNIFSGALRVGARRGGELTLQDSFGLINARSITGVLTGSTTTGNNTNQSLTDSLGITSPDQGQTYNITGNLKSLADGYYTLSLTGQDWRHELQL